MTANRDETAGRIVVSLPDVPELAHIGDLPRNVELRLAPAEAAVAATAADLEDVDLIVPGAGTRTALLDLLAAGGGRLRVIQTTSAGVDWLIGRVPGQIVVCNARGVYDVSLAEWVVGAILAMQRGLIDARDAGARHEWASIEPPELAGSRVLILGLGSIGSAIAERLRPFGVALTGVGRVARDEVRGLDELDRLLPEADVLVDILPLTSATDGLIDGRRLALLPDGALVVNAGRGRTIDPVGLLAELRAGRLRAALDVTEPEPLPPDHELWDLPNVLITPHMAGDSPAATIGAFTLVGDQIRRFATGEPMVNEVARYLLE